MDEHAWEELMRQIGDAMCDSRTVEFPRRFDALRPLINENPRAIFPMEEDGKDFSSDLHIVLVGEVHLFQVRVDRKACELNVVRRHPLAAIDEIRCKKSRDGDTMLTCRVGNRTILKRQAGRAANVRQLHELAKALAEATSS